MSGVRSETRNPKFAAAVRAGWVTILAAIALGTFGCSGDGKVLGYSSKSLYTSAYKTVAVPIFGNKTFRKQLEMRLTEAVDKNIEARTPYKIQSDRKRADTVLEAEIVDVAESPLTRRFGTNLPRETELIISVNFTWKDARTGRILVQRKGFVRDSTEIPPLGERIADAEQRAIEDIAYAIVSQLQKDF